MTTTVTTGTASSVDTKVSAAIREMMAERRKKEAGSAAAPVEVEIPKVKAPAVVVGDGYVHSHTFGLKDAFAVRVFQTEDWDEQVRRLIPDVDPLFVAPKDELATLLRAWEDGDRTMIYGPTGAGKSSLVRHACALTKRPFIRVNLTRDTDSGQLFGERGIDVGKGDTFKIGPVTEAVRYGAVLLLDEWTLMQAEISMGLQYVMEDGGKLYLKEMPGNSEDKTITPHEHFRLVAGDNTNGQGDETGAFVGTSVQNSATLDRFGTAFRLDYLPAKDEIAMLAHRFPDAPAAALKSFRLVAEQIRKAYEQGNVTLTLSPRGLINVVRKYMAVGDVRRAFDLAYVNKLRESDARVANALIDKVFPRS